MIFRFFSKLIYGRGLDEHKRSASYEQKADQPQAFFSSFYSLHRLHGITVWERRGNKGHKKDVEKAAVGCGAGGRDREDLIKDHLCYVISSKRRRPHCCRDVEQLARGCLIACSDPFQASSSGAHTRNGTDVYSCLPWQRLHGIHWLLQLLWSSDTSPSWDWHSSRISERAQLLQQRKISLFLTSPKMPP